MMRSMDVGRDDGPSCVFSCCYYRGTLFFLFSFGLYEFLSLITRSLLIIYFIYGTLPFRRSFSS